LSKVNWFQVGGKAELMFRPKTEAELKEFLEFCPQEVPIFVFGVGSNIIIRDGGIRGVVLRLGREFATCQMEAENKIKVGASCLDVNLSQFAMLNSLAGLEFFSGIPGTVGGAIKMNAGAYGGETKDVLLEVYGYDRSGKKHVLKAADLNFSYRQSNPQLPNLIYVGGLFQGQVGVEAEIRQKMEDIQTKREATQPIRAKTGGSTFKNGVEYSAWQLVERAGCRGLKIGDAQISEKHCNFMINTGNAKASDLEELGEVVRGKVKEKTGIELNWEIKRIGEKNE
jgi:UDP-N-acetylmuramate dehydrogenase